MFGRRVVLEKFQRGREFLQRKTLDETAFADARFHSIIFAVSLEEAEA
jgi:hypothetical protein